MFLPFHLLSTFDFCYPDFSLLCDVFPPLEVTLALLDAATDKDSEVQEQVRKSMLTLGKQQPDRVLAMCQDYLLKHPKVQPKETPPLHRMSVSLMPTLINPSTVTCS